MAQAAILAPAIFLYPNKVTAEILAKRPDLDPAAANSSAYVSYRRKSTGSWEPDSRL
ncbi:MAG TPA: hypothetical protein VK741_29350 [Acetobacteraceae bacterium]|nr:hypothetical protein [Acetobacteraceae bacterium]